MAPTTGLYFSDKILLLSYLAALSQKVSMYKATVHQKTFEITLSPSSEVLMINGEPLNWDLVRFEDGHFHILYNQKSYRVEVIKTDHTAKTFSFKINGRMYPVQLKDKFDLLLEKMGLNAAVSGKVNNVKAPMPGLIIDLKVKEGDEVKLNDPLLILEAMKMENILKSPGDGVVKSVKIKKGDSVEKNQVLIEF